MPFKSKPRFAIFCSGYVVFLCIGACIFLAIEEEEEHRYLQSLQQLKIEFLEKHPCVHYRDLHSILRAFEDANHVGILGSENVSNWSFGESLFFATTIVTTVGYGHLAPLSSSGRIFTIIFAIIGIPLTLIILSALTDRLYIPTNALLRWLHSKLKRKCQPFYLRLLHLTILLIAGIIIFLIIPALIYHCIEQDWDFIDSLYFCFLTVTTIGFGDFTPGDSGLFRQKHEGTFFRNAYKFCTTTYLFLGVMYAMLSLAVFSNIPQLNIGVLYTTGGGPRSLSIFDSESYGGGTSSVSTVGTSSVSTTGTRQKLEKASSTSEAASSQLE